MLYMLQGIVFEYTFCLALVTFSLYLFYVIMSKIFAIKKIFKNNKEMRMKEWEKYKHTPGITFLRLKYPTRRSKVKYKGRRYIAAKRKGKAQVIGNKRPVKYNFIVVETNTTYVVSSTENKHQDIKFKHDSDSFEIGIDNHASKCIEKDKINFISRITPTSNTILRGHRGKFKSERIWNGKMENHR